MKSNCERVNLCRFKYIAFILPCTEQKMKFSIKGFFSKCDQIQVTFTEEIFNGKLHFLCRKLRIWSLLLKKSLMENFTFGAGNCGFGHFY